jgi:hypothetical protein
LLTLDNKTRSRNPALTLAVLLGLAVFFWGLSYKLSLYHTVKNEQAAQAAKLLSQRERPASNLKIESCWGAGQPLRGIPRTTLSHPHWALLAPTPFEVAWRSQNLFGTPPDQARQIWRITCRGARPPPLAA